MKIIKLAFSMIGLAFVISIATFVYSASAKDRIVVPLCSGAAVCVKGGPVSWGVGTAAVIRINKTINCDPTNVYGIVGYSREDPEQNEIGSFTKDIPRYRIPMNQRYKYFGIDLPASHGCTDLVINLIVTR